MQKIIKILSVFTLCQFFLISGVGYGGEEELFSLMVDPDALITMDLSGSMHHNPGGENNYQVSPISSGANCSDEITYPQYGAGHTYICYDAGGHIWGDSSCLGPFYRSSGSGHSTNCSKAEIARRAIFALLDDNGDGNIQKKDQETLGIRLAYMRFKKCSVEDSPLSYSSGCNVLMVPFQSLSTNNYYKGIYDQLVSDMGDFGGLTPLRVQLLEGKAYLDSHKSTDTLKECRKKFVIFVTDGWDTLACGHCSGCQEENTGSYGYKRRKSTIKAAKALGDAGYKVFVIGFGADMPQTERYTLEWAAYFGGTDNPLVPNSGNTSAITTVDDPCLTHATCTPSQSGCTNAPMDPGYAPLTGYAYLATDATALNQALRRAIEYVKEARYSFTVSSVSAARVSSENYLYEASFIPLESDPFWLGHLKKYGIDDAGRVSGVLWDAGNVLKNKPASARNMWTYLGGTTLRAFDTSISPTYFGYQDDAAGNTARTAIVGYVRGETSYNQDNWKLGDIFHSNPITVGSPPVYYNDFRSPAAYVNHRNNNGGRERLVVLGANDGQFHAFSGSNGEEKWSFIPPNLLRKLSLISHSTEPAIYPTHQFFVDGPVTVTEAWLGSGDGLNKVASDWRTLLIFGLGKGVRESNANSDPTYLWSSSPLCDSDFKRKYNPPYQYYCGYYAFDVTDTAQTQPLYKWRINVANSGQGYYLDEPWSKMVTGRVRIDGNEKWVGFIGGGFSGDIIRKNRDFDDDDFETKGKRGGKGFHVIDLSNGNILWSYTRGIDSNMDYPIPAAPAVADLDGDGFVDVAYIADLGGNLWRFRFCSFEDYQNNQPCNTDNWKGGRLFASTMGYDRPVFTRPSLAADEANQLWVFWGTGNKVSPSDTSSQERFFAVKETFVPVKSADLPPSYIIDNLQNISSTTYSGVLPGWHMLLPGIGEKNLSDSTVFGGMVLFTTYTPALLGAQTCSSAGTGRLYAMAMMPMVIGGVLYKPGAGLWAGGERSISLGAGVPTAPVISQKPRDKSGPTDIYVSVSGGGGSETMVWASGGGGSGAGGAAATRLGQTPPQAQVIHWRDRRIQ